MSGSTTANGVRDFDFLYGSWDMLNERLVSRLTGSTEWERFESRAECWPILGGAGNVDTLSARLNGQNFEGASLRIYDPASNLWSIYWADNVRNELFPPVRGRFVDGIGEFNGEDAQDGVPVLVRFRWSDITDSSAR